MTLLINPIRDGIGSASLIELLWLVVCLVGFAYHRAALLFMLHRQASMRLRGINGANEVLAAQNVRDETGRVVRSAVYTLIGIAVAFIPPPAAPTIGTAVANLLIGSTFIAVQMYDVWLSAMARRDNYKILELLLEESPRVRRRWRGKKGED